MFAEWASQRGCSGPVDCHHMFRVVKAVYVAFHSMSSHDLLIIATKPQNNFVDDCREVSYY